MGFCCDCSFWDTTKRKVTGRTFRAPCTSEWLKKIVGVKDLPMVSERFECNSFESRSETMEIVDTIEMMGQ